jgi:hypothetical protein
MQKEKEKKRKRNNKKKKRKEKKIWCSPFLSSTGTMFGRMLQFLPRSCIYFARFPSEGIGMFMLKDWGIAEVWFIGFSHPAYSRDVMKSGAIPASSSSTRAHTLP